MKYTKLLLGLSSAFFGAVVSDCAPAPCHRARTIDLALEENCPTDQNVTPLTTCTPRAGNICTVIGMSEAGFGTENLPGSRTKLSLPIDTLPRPNSEDIFFLDWNNHRVRVLDINGLVHTVVGSGELSDADATSGSMPSRMPTDALDFRLNHPTGVAFDASGFLWVAAWHNSSVKRVNLQTGILESPIGTGARGFGGDGMSAYDSVLNLPVGILFLSNGDMLVADQANQRIRRVNSQGIIETVIGSGEAGFAGDNGPASTAKLNNLTGQRADPSGRMTMDSRGRLYIADTENHRIRMVDTTQATWMISTVVGSGVRGTGGDGGQALLAELNRPTDVAVASDGTLYIADTENSCIRMVRPNGVISTFAGHCGQPGFDGEGNLAELSHLDHPYGVEVDHHDNVWIADTANNVIRLVCSSNGGARCTTNNNTP